MDNLIYHYCSRSAFLGIIKSKSLWATDLSKMNDPHEISKGKKVIEKMFAEYFPDSKFIDNRSLFDFSDDLYLASSSSKEGNLLSQWRSYANDGAGFSVGIDAEILRRINLNPWKSGIPLDESELRGVPEFSISEVLYDEILFREKLTKLFDEHRRDYGVPYQKGRSGFRTSDMHLFSQLLEMSCLLKSEFYKEEQEVRIFKTKKREYLLTDGKNPRLKKYSSIDFIDSPYGIKAYMPIFLSNESAELSAIKEVVLGPKNDSNLEDVELF